MFKSYSVKLPIRHGAFNLYVTGIFVAIISIIFFVSSYVDNEINDTNFMVTPLSGLEQKVDDTGVKVFNLTSKTAIIRSTGIGSYLISLKAPSCASSNFSILSRFPVLSKNNLVKQTENSWALDSQESDDDTYLVIQTTGIPCAGPNPILMTMELSVSNK